MPTVVPVDGETLASMEVDMHEVYSPDSTFLPAEKREAEYWDSVPEDRGIKLEGKHFNWRIAKNYAWGSGTPGELSEWSKAGRHGSAEARITPARFDSVIELTQDAIDRTGNGGSYDIDLVDRMVNDAATVLALTTEFRALGPGTNQLALVRANTAASDTFFTAVNDPGIGGSMKLRSGMKIDIADLASGGVVQYAGVEILDVDPVTGETVTDTVMSLDAGWSVFQADTYGEETIVGLDAIVDNGDVAPVIFNVTRADSEKFRSPVIGDNDTLVSYSEDIMDELLVNLSQRAGYTPTYLLCNEGMAIEHRKLGGKDKIYPVMGDKMPIFGQGGDHTNTWYQWGSEKIPFKINKNVSPRVIYGIYQPSIRKAYLRRPDWYRGETGDGMNPRLRLKPGINNWTYVVVGSLLSKCAQICKALNANGKAVGFRDRLLGDDND